MEKRNQKYWRNGIPPRLRERRVNFERARSLWADKKGAWLAMDFEAWENDHKILTEFGWSCIRWENDDVEISERGHWIVKEHRKYTNTKYVKGNRDVGDLVLPNELCDAVDGTFLIFRTTNSARAKTCCSIHGDRA